MPRNQLSTILLISLCHGLRNEDPWFFTPPPTLTPYVLSSAYHKEKAHLVWLVLCALGLACVLQPPRVTVPRFVHQVSVCRSMFYKVVV